MIGSVASQPQRCDVFYDNVCVRLVTTVECHRCYGVETLLLNVVSRTSTDDQFCGDGGAILTTEQYAFNRVDWAYPCGAQTTTQELRTISRNAAVRRQKRLAREANSRLV